MATAIRTFFTKFKRTELPGRITLLPRTEQTLLYQRRKYPGWIKWFYAIAGLDIFMTASTMDLVWRYWSEPTTVEASYGLDEEEEQSQRYVLRSTYQRFSAASLVFFAGAYAATILASMRSKYVLGFHITPNGLGGRAVFLQTYKTGMLHGYHIPLQECYLAPNTANKTPSLLLEVEGVRFPWHITPDNAQINGQDVKNPLQVKDAIVRAWGTQNLDPELSLFKPIHKK
ncbi:hypothetical protein CYLTODRAFT_491985 [Cylindrobasidium torrendii FP15055 ss-10]|uniref:Uncharacterized protein n=1 Tax=Cylindrobasidium torrendii FP15055 ss-10 TaxID=1314674 RepID=A0A0D7B8K1_9AGAR|nr:hypothetical protein CYLTODRAFT_491985 [Cylindrobasidium torrendii FP15055 ss-10]